MQVALSEAHRLSPLYADRTGLRVVADAVLEGRLGSAWADEAASPSAARLDIGSYAFFGGDPATPGARGLVEGVRSPCELLFPDSDAWRELLRAVHGPRLSDRPMQGFDTENLDPELLTRLSSHDVDGFRIERPDESLAAQLGAGLEPHALQVFQTPADFVARGRGYFATRDGKIAAAATSYAISAKGVEVAIATHPDFRRLGLARIVAARLMLECLEDGLTPEWNASNPISKHLAARLGYQPGAVCEISYLED